MFPPSRSTIFEEYILNSKISIKLDTFAHILHTHSAWTQFTHIVHTVIHVAEMRAHTQHTVHKQTKCDVCAMCVVPL